MKSQAQWLVSPLFDGFWFIASPLVAVAFYYLFVLWGPALEGTMNSSSVFFFFLIFTGLFDAPHIFSTFARTHLDPVERQRNFLFHGVSLMLALAISISSVLMKWDELFMTLLGLYGAWHIVRQNIGFVRLYQRMNSRIEDAGFGPEINLLTASLPYYYLHGHSDIEEFLSMYLSESGLFAVQRVSELVLLYFAFKVFWSNYQSRKKYGAWNTPKIFLVLSSLGLVFWLSFLNVHPLMLIALSTIGHDLQYQAWMWVYNHRRTQHRKRPLWVLAACMIVGILIAVGPDQWAPLYNGFVLWHYFIDGYIWRVGSSPELASIFQRPEVTIPA